MGKVQYVPTPRTPEELNAKRKRDSLSAATGPACAVPTGSIAKATPRSQLFAAADTGDDKSNYKNIENNYNKIKGNVHNGNVQYF